ncbi:MAG TPA: DUF4191 domain-containing protein [Gordonia polyisoprenivorans]|uniref:DUF4191 domain-containing protein n=1 Tax=Gordonia TaxID=2053 RepID=UPI00035C538B|nr:MULTISPECIES: DUF4191 domain-containing protein [Gordonia]MBE7193714.1 DUF4191 domain-containing protein [Gordonia polyisoprenivorans]MDF3280288.1 DUF4191 domain-containing protein [Gordonia sp. N1V]OZC30992.1 DUF4191 domain-containing protein [Gordonia polyisoprenivorans]QUD84618.1 DUF4191 domain-containing protein [Gordonia polyisoprenivorans]UZF54265.1 DUF4191 domain-containing protein [Gordonia polyisoprenivorans]
MAKAQAASKADKKAARQARRKASKERFTQLWQAFQMQRKEDKRLIPYMVGLFVLIVAIFVVIGLFVGSPWLLVPIGVVLGILAAFLLFGRRVQKTVYTKAEGQPGAAGWALSNMRGQWRVQQAVTGTSHLDAVHRVIGKPGVILVGEGSPSRVTTLLGQEKKKVARVVGDTPIYQIMVGNDDGQVPLSKLERHLNKLPGNIDRKRMETLEGRLSALGGKQPGPGMPKGPLPGNAKMRSMQRTARRRGA